MANRFIIDVWVADRKPLMRRLEKLKTTTFLGDCGAYAFDQQYSMLALETTWTEQQLDKWLWSSKGIGYEGYAEVTPGDWKEQYFPNSVDNL